MKKRVLTLIALVAMAMGSLYAGNVDQRRAQRIGQQFLSKTELGQDRTDLQLRLVSAAIYRDGVDYYAFNVKGGDGFVIVAGDDRVKPILAYSTSGTFDPENVAEGFAFMLNGYRSEIQYVREHNLTASPDIAAEWQSLRTTGNIRQGRSSRSVVGPLCQTTWNQNFPWNSQCPEDPEGNGGHVYAGCVATAMGQVMKFWDYPDHGTGSHTYNPSGYPQQTANFGETDYHFELMPLALDSTSTEDDYFYVAQFLHHCGIAVDMQYSGNGSGAYSQDVPSALSNYFGFTTLEYESLSFWGWNWYTNEEWAQMLKDGGLDEHLPLYYSGSDDNGAGGHAFVCDGYDENDYFHFNWGWSGRDDAWCPIGVLNTTKYAFNDMNSFIGHIVPQNASYYLRSDSVTDFVAQENRDDASVLLSWNNPTTNLNGDALTSIESVTVRRNNQVVATLTDAEVGAAMTYEDSALEPGLYEYSVFVTTTEGVSRNVYRNILVGEKCDVVFQLHDAGGDGWKGAAISVTDENGQRIAVITMTEGSELTLTVPLLSQNLTFIWNHGWYHTNELYDTDSQCSFTIRDPEGNEIYASDTLDDGPFLLYDNNCEQAGLTCHPVENLDGEYQWHNGEEFGAMLTWDAPVNKTNLRYFQIYRTMGAYKDDEWIAEIPFDGANSYSYFDNAFDVLQEDVYYSVNCVYVLDDEQCESEFRDVMVTITGMKESIAQEVLLFPNPSDGLLTISGSGVMRVEVSNLLGQKVGEFVLQDSAVVNLGHCESGVYLVRIATAHGVSLHKVSINH